MRCEGFDVARCTASRLMRSIGLNGVVQGSSIRTAIPDTAASYPLDRLNHFLTTPRPNMPWVSDFTYVANGSGFVYIAQATNASHLR